MINAKTVQNSNVKQVTMQNPILKTSSMRHFEHNYGVKRNQFITLSDGKTYKGHSITVDHQPFFLLRLPNQKFYTVIKMPEQYQFINAGVHNISDAVDAIAQKLERSKNPVKGAANPKSKKLQGAEYHQHKILLSNFKLVPFMRSHSIAETRKILKEKYGYTDQELNRIEAKYPSDESLGFKSNPHGFAIVDEHLNVQAKGRNFDTLQSKVDSHNEAHSEQWFVIDADDLKEVRGKGVRKVGNPMATVKNSSITESDFTHINNDVYGNPRYVLHFLALASTYERALKIARKIGGKKFHNKQYGGGIVFSTYDMPRLISRLNDAKENPVKGGGVVNPSSQDQDAVKQLINEVQSVKILWLTALSNAEIKLIKKYPSIFMIGGVNRSNKFVQLRGKANGSTTGGVVNPRHVNNEAFTIALHKWAKALGYRNMTDYAVAYGYHLMKAYKEPFNYSKSGLLHNETKIAIRREVNNLLEKYTERRTKRNSTATDFKATQSNKLKQLAKMFQGAASGEKRRVLESDYTPKDKYRLGYLVQIKIKDGGKIIPINFDGEAYLSADLKNNLWVAGKDAIIDNIKRPANGSLKYLGEVVQVDYITAKKHIEGGKTVRFYHKLGEVTRERPNLFLDHDGFPIFVGGGYDVWDVGIVN